MLRAHLAALADRRVSFTAAPFRLAEDAGEDAGEEAPSWTVERRRTILGYEPAGPPVPDGLFARCRLAVREYRFADPRITHGHFDAGAPLLGRDILVDVHAVVIRLLVGLRVTEVLDRVDGDEARFGVRLETLEGHILDGSEWVVVTKVHRTGAVGLRIEALWRQGRLPTWWMGLGFRLFGRQLQARWRRQAARRLRALGS